MLEEISIKNFAIIEDASMTPSTGLNVITGETGAGKSILLEALSFLFAETGADETMIRRGAPRLEVSARLTLKKGQASALKDRFEELGLETAGELVVRRVYESAGRKTRSWINDTPVSGALLKEVSRACVVFHTQGKTEEMLSAPFALRYLDQWAALEPETTAVQRAWSKTSEARACWQEHQDFVAQNQSKADFLKFQLEEIESAGLDKETLRRMQEDLPLWTSRGALAESLSEVRAALNEEDASASTALSKALGASSRALKSLKGHAELEALQQNLNQAQALIQEASEKAESLSSAMEFDPDSLEELLAKKSKMERLLSKHRLADPAALAELENNLRSQYQALINADIENAALQKAVQTAEAELKKAADKLTAARKKEAKKLSKAIQQEFLEVGLEKAAFDVELKERECTAQGAEDAEFLFAANPGEGLKPLRLVASSGEASRLMLALLTAQSRSSGAVSGGSLVFDEIEQGLSSKMTAVVAEKLKSLAANAQLFVITHSPVLACMPCRHFVVAKRPISGRTISTVSLLEGEEARLQEALRLLGTGDPQEKKFLMPYIESLFRKTEKRKNSAAIS